MAAKCRFVAAGSTLCVLFLSIMQAPARAQLHVKLDSPAVTEWEARIPAIQQVLGDNPLYHCANPKPHTNILDAFGLAGSQLSVALVDWCPGGAYTDWIVAMRLQSGQPIVAQFRDTNGEQVPNGFAQGSSVMHSVDVQMVPDKNAVYDFYSDNNGEGKLWHCRVKAYVWNAETKTFDQSIRLSKLATVQYCAKLREQQ
jgi:hypothetical protein